MAGWLDSNGLRVAAYLLVAVASLVVGLRERRWVASNPNLWPWFWYLTAALFVAMALGRATDIGDLATALGRNEAFTHGWYAHRRRIQSVVVGTLAGVWFVVVSIALWRVPERRRRYLPAAIMAFTLVCFAGIRLVSLHQIDGLLYRRQIAGAKFGAVVELVLLALALAATLWQPGAAPVGAGRRVGTRRAQVPRSS
jgi:hypothetical protein